MEIILAIVEDNQFHLENLQSILRNWEKQHTVITLKIECYADGESFLADYQLKKKQYHLIFLDIELAVDSSRKMSGLAVARNLRSSGYANQIVFSTSFEKYSIEGYDVQAMYYFLKPASAEQIEKCMKTLYQQIFGETLQIKTTEGFKSLLYSSILYLTSRRNYTEITTSYAVFSCKEPISSFEKRLPEFFVRCSRFNIVNFHHISGFVFKEIELSDGTKMPVTDSYRNEIKKRFVFMF